MNEAPEGLEYGTDNYKYAKADKCEPELERGKYAYDHANGGEILERIANSMHDTTKASHDPYHKHSQKNR